MPHKYPDRPITSKNQVVGDVNAEPSSRVKRPRRETVTEDKEIIILGPRGPLKVPVKKGDTIVTTTVRDGKGGYKTILSVDKPSTNQSLKKTKLKVNKVNKTNTRSNTVSRTSTNKVSNETSQEDLNSQLMTPYEHWYRLNFIKSYVNAYKNKSPELNWYNYLLKNLKDPDGVWKEIWPLLEETNTPELSAQHHDMLFTKDGVGLMNWYNIFDGNLLHATADNLSIPRSSLDYVSPEWRTKTILLTTNPLYTAQTSNVQVSDNIDELIKQNSDLFKKQYEYAKQNNGAFDYTPSSFDTSNLNVNYKYGGIGDFMDTYGLNPLGLYKRLDNIYGTE